MARTPSSIIVIAPQAAGKTRHAAAIAKMFGCTSIVDEWDGKERLPHGALALTTLSPDELVATPAGANARSRRSRP